MGYLAAVLCAIAWGIQLILMKLMFRHTSPAVAGLYCCGGAPEPCYQDRL